MTGTKSSTIAHNEMHLAEHLCTRLCHDITGSIGALNNGLELMQEGEDVSMHADALELVHASAIEASARLQFYRQAYGKLNEFGEASLAEKKEITEAFFAASRITLDWPDTHAQGAEISVSQKMGRLLLNMLIIVSRSMLRGGTLSVRLEHNAEHDTRDITVVAVGDMLKPDDNILAMIKGDAYPELSPKTVQGYLTFNLAEQMNTRISLIQHEGSFGLRASRR